MSCLRGCQCLRAFSHQGQRHALRARRPCGHNLRFCLGHSGTGGLHLGNHFGPRHHNGFLRGAQGGDLGSLVHHLCLGAGGIGLQLGQVGGNLGLGRNHHLGIARRFGSLLNRQQARCLGCLQLCSRDRDRAGNNVAHLVSSPGGTQSHDCIAVLPDGHAEIAGDRHASDRSLRHFADAVDKAVIEFDIAALNGDKHLGDFIQGCF